MHIILVHGIFETGRSWRPLAQKLTDEGHTCWIPSLKPFDARLGIADLSSKLQAYIDQNVPEAEPYIIIAFSMGCIVSRYFLQILGGASRCKALFALAGPHQGSPLCHLYIGQGVKDMKSNSPLLRQLEQTIDTLDSVELHAYWSKYDLIVPAHSANWTAADSTEVKVLLHDLIPRSPVVAHSIIQKITTITNLAS